MISITETETDKGHARHVTSGNGMGRNIFLGHIYMSTSGEVTL